jgi:hypothetical protein
VGKVGVVRDEPAEQCELDVLGAEVVEQPTSPAEQDRYDVQVPQFPALVGSFGTEGADPALREKSPPRPVDHLAIVIVGSRLR